MVTTSSTVPGYDMDCVNCMALLTKEAAPKRVPALIYN
ncbi:hypothetical protein ACTODO_00015 [Schaalia dentiphila ATCC 17982]|uniref:Uncharacterized protein n=1 Tax=Schaalia dentiphila ATCC 17982 TaxID=411466 RepID=A7B8R5_9ACTO|nr:hypothetical protein ACTODO_00015 [Schaalia odontolytica ATCC 17982]